MLDMIEKLPGVGLIADILGGKSPEEIGNNWLENTQGLLQNPVFKTAVMVANPLAGTALGMLGSTNAMGSMKL